MTHGTITSIRPNRGDGRGFGRIALDGGGPALSFDKRVRAACQSARPSLPSTSDHSEENSRLSPGSPVTSR